jgi:membrane protein DedA with SNARE-associated domain
MPASIGQPPGIVAAILFLAFFAQALKEIGIPSPGLTQSLLLYAGYQFSGGGLFFGVGIVFATCVGSLSGACLVFGLAKFGGDKLLAIINRYTFITPDAIEKARKKVSAYSFISVSVGRSIPGFMVPTSIAAGVIKMPIRKFLLGIILPLSLWIIFFTSLGSTAGYFSPRIKFNPASFLVLLGALIAVGIPASMLYHRKNQTDLKSINNQPIPIGEAIEDEQ